MLVCVPGVGVLRCVGVCGLGCVMKLAVLIPEAGMVGCGDCPGVVGMDCVGVGSCGQSMGMDP